MLQEAFFKNILLSAVNVTGEIYATILYVPVYSHNLSSMLINIELGQNRLLTNIRGSMKVLGAPSIAQW